MLIIKSSDSYDRLSSLLDRMDDNEEEFFVILPLTFRDKDFRYESIENRILQMGGDFVYAGTDWVWVTDDNWDGDLSNILPSVG